MIAGIAWTLTTPQLAIADIEVNNNEMVNDETVQQLARTAIGMNIFLIKSKDIRQSVTRRPEIADVKIRRRLPQTLSLKVTERIPFAVVTAGAGYFETDKDGLIIRRVRSPNPNLPLVSLEKPIRLQPGERPGSDSMAAALNCLTLSQENDYRISKLSVDRLGNVCLNMGSGFYVKLGQAEQVAEKLSIIRTTVQARPDIAQEVLYIDVSCPSAPALKRRPQAEKPESQFDSARG